MALTADRNTPRREGVCFSDPLAAAALIFAGAMYALDATGNAVKATAGGTAVRAVAQRRADQAGGHTRVDGERGIYCFENGTAGAAISRANIGAVAYVVDDQTVGKTGTAVAGVIVDFDDRGVWVDIGAHSITVEAGA
ncbi:hypothetical protein [Variovorax sp.]|uniref:hypothetical protein n=1 Tax=Variovorax sp. TaxID=1871043 RepID=UPI003BAC3CEC